MLDCVALAAAAEAGELAAVLACGFEGGEAFEGVHGFAFCLGFDAGGLAFVGLVEEELGFRGGAAGFAQLEHLNAVEAAVRR